MGKEKNKIKVLALIFIVLLISFAIFAMNREKKEEKQVNDLIPEEFKPIEDFYDELETDLDDLWSRIISVRSEYIDFEDEVDEIEYDRLGEKLAEIKNDFYDLERNALDGRVSFKEGREKISEISTKILELQSEMHD